ncbi:MAG: FAD-dependent oxidoreductase, partial [Fibrobacterota bacterium]
EGSDFVIKADMVLLAMGFTHFRDELFGEELDIEKDERGNIKTDGSLMTSVEGLFAAGDCRTGASLVVKALADARKASEEVDKFLRR